MTTRTTKTPKITNICVVFGFEGGGTGRGVGVGRAMRVGSGVSPDAELSGVSDFCECAALISNSVLPELISLPACTQLGDVPHKINRSAANTAIMKIQMEYLMRNLMGFENMGDDGRPAAANVLRHADFSSFDLSFSGFAA